jgi:hypothetical protein
MEKARGGAYRAFTEHLATERARAEQFATNLSEAGRRKYLAAFESPERRLDIFERWLERSGSLQPSLSFAETLVRSEGEGDVGPDTSALVQ